MLRYLTFFLFLAPQVCLSDTNSKLCSKESIAEWKEKIINEVNTNSFYPKIAEMRGWKGKGSVFVLVKSDGSITTKTLIDSTGYEVLDKAMLSFFSKSKFPELECDIDRIGSTPLLLPFNFDMALSTTKPLIFEPNPLFKRDWLTPAP